MVSKSEKTKRKFEVESKEENDIQQICYFNICRNLGLHGIHSKKSGPAWSLSPKIPKENAMLSLKKRRISNKFVILTYAEIWTYIVVFLKRRALHGV